MSTITDALQVARAHIAAAREELRLTHTEPTTGRVDADGQAGMDADDAVIALIDVAMQEATGQGKLLAPVPLSVIRWHAVADGLPDAESNVLLATDDGNTLEGFYDGHHEHVAGRPPLFRDVCAQPLELHAVTHWAGLPGGPNRSTSA